jgi:hypothetical protein
MGPKALPLAGEQAMALEVAKAPVVGDDLEAVADRLPATARAVAAIAALARERPDQLGALQRVQSIDPAADVRLGHCGGLEQRRRQ